MALLTDDGIFKRPEIGDIREELEEMAKEDISPDVPTDDAHLLGELLGIISMRDDILEQGIEAVFYALFVLTSHGDVLDRYGTEEYVYRKPAASASVELQIDGYPGGYVERESLFSTEDGVLFQTVDDLTFGEVTQIDDPDNPGTKIDLQDTNGEGLCRVTVNAMAVESGVDGNVKSDAITYNADANEDIFAVTNLAAATGGQNAEIDKPYAERIIANRISGSSSSENGIETKINNLPDVTQAKVVGNNTMETDKYGNPPKSTHLYVIGGNDQEIAEAYFDIIGVPGYSIGAIEKTVLNLSGDKRLIRFDRAQTVPVYMQIKLATNDDFDADNGANNIKANLKTFFADYRMGSTVLFSQIFGQIWSVPGITDIKLAIGKDKDSLSLTDIPMDEFELATTDNDLIEVIVDA